MQNKENSFFDNLEENFIAITLGLMTIVTFANVIARYIFNDNILWGLEQVVVVVVVVAADADFLSLFLFLCC